MELHADESVVKDEVITSEESPKQEEAVDSSNNNAPIEKKSYGKKFSARIYKFFSLFMFFVYYINFMIRLISNCVNYFMSQGIKTIPQWWAYTTDTSNWKGISESIFDWYTITLLVFLALYFVVFLITFIRYSPKHKKTFKFFKKGFVMARRVIKLISVGLTLTVFVNSATKFETFGDKFMFVVSLFAIFFTIIQIIISVFSWIVGRKLNKSVKKYVSNVMNSYIATTRVRPNAGIGKGKTVGDKLGNVKDRFVRTMDAMTMTKEEAMQRDAELEGYVVEDNNATDRFENDYQPEAVETIQEEETVKDMKKSKLGTKRVKLVSQKKVKSDKK